MAGMGAGYDLSVSTFSPDGRVFQVEYATKAVDNASTVLSFVCSDGVILGLEKPMASKMVVPGSVPRIFAVDRHVSLCCAGFNADGRQIVQRARQEAAQYRNVFEESIPGHVLAERLGGYIHAHTLAWSLRPLGVSVLLAVFDKENEEKPAVYCIEPSGGCYKYRGMALGKARQSAKTEIEKLDLSSLRCADAAFEVVRILNKIRDDAKKDVHFEVAWICPESGYKHQLLPFAMVQELNERAQKQLEEEDVDM